MRNITNEQENYLENNFDLNLFVDEIEARENAEDMHYSIYYDPDAQYTDFTN